MLEHSLQAAYRPSKASFQTEHRISRASSISFFAPFFFLSLPFIRFHYLSSRSVHAFFIWRYFHYQPCSNRGVRCNRCRWAGRQNIHAFPPCSSQHRDKGAIPSILLLNPFSVAAVAKRCHANISCARMCVHDFPELFRLSCPETFSIHIGIAAAINTNPSTFLLIFSAATADARRAFLAAEASNFFTPLFWFWSTLEHNGGAQLRAPISFVSSDNSFFRPVSRLSSVD